jgi:hypothetical protein
MTSTRIAHAWLGLGLFALAAIVCVPPGYQAGDLLTIAADPAAIADRKLDGVFDAAVAQREIETALAANDSDLAKSFLDLATERGLVMPTDLAGKVTAAVDHANSVGGAAESFARGLITGKPDDVVSLAGTTLGDLFVFGDIRDAVREGSRYANGGQVDELVLGLACVGIVITAGTYASFGAASPARVGLSAVKAVRKTGRLTEPLAAWIGRSLREMVDWSALRRVGASWAEPAVAVRVAREAVKVAKTGGLVRLVNDIGRVQTRAGTQAALDGLKIARGPADVTRVAKLAEKKGSKTRAILKMLGSGALFLSVATFNLSLWILGAIAAMLGLVSSTKSIVERWTLRQLARKKQRKLQRQSAEVVGASGLNRRRVWSLSADHAVLPPWPA